MRPLREDLGLRFGLTMFALVLIFAVAFGLITIQRLRHATLRSLERNAEVYSEKLTDLLLDAVANGNYAFVDQTIRRSVDGESILYGRLMLTDMIAAVSSDPGQLGVRVRDRTAERARREGRTVRELATTLSGQPALEVAVPLGDASLGNLAVLCLGFSLEPVSDAVRAAAAAVAVEVGLFIILGAIVSIGFTRRVSQPIRALTEHAALLRSGDLTTPVLLDSADQLGVLARTLDQMRIALSAKIDELSRTIQELSSSQEANRRLQELDDAKTRFFSSVSHELRTPLTLLLGPISAILAAPAGLSSEERQRLDRAFRNGKQLLHLVNELLDFAKLQAGSAELDFRPTNPTILIREIVEAATPMADDRGLELSFDSSRDDHSVLIDQGKFSTVARNLIGNAIKFTPVGGRIAVELSESEALLTLTVADTGPGIPETLLPEIFEAFHQGPLQPSPTNQGSGAKRDPAARYRVESRGTGLGLALCKEIAELCGGTIDVSSQVGQGSTFRVSIPVTRAAAEVIAATSPADAGDLGAAVDVSAASVGGRTGPELDAVLGGAAPAGAERLLLVDDNLDFLSFLSDLLRDRYRLFFAVDGQEGIDRCRAELPDLVISDVMMPRRSGFELVEELKSDPKTQHVPILLVTARAGAEGVIEGLKWGADEYIGKPFDPLELLARIDALARLTRLERRLAELNASLEKKVEERTARLNERNAQLELALKVQRSTRKETQRLNRLLGEAQESHFQGEGLAVIGRVAATVAHDLKNPLTAIAGWAELAATAGTPARRDEYMQAIRDEMARLVDLVETILIASRGEVRLDLKAIDAEVFFSRAVRYLSRLVATSSVVIRHRCAPAIGPLLIDSGQIQRVLYNLAANAVDAMPEGGTFEIDVSPADAKVRVTCTDSGPGVPAAIRQNLFTELFTYGKPHGTGLGLSLSKAIVREHGGDIWYEEAPGGGARFVLTLPRGAGEEAEPGHEPS
ncbi:MAG: response regulator [Candidatus Schekmanbacteria bacterium]|nr:response regulator [Candidatus Schekmanbacteria bacterium]